MNHLVLGRMEHARTAKAERAHRFSYPWFGVLASYPIQSHGRWFTHNQFGFLSFDDRDHGLRDNSNPLDWLQTQLDLVDLAYRVSDLQIEVLTMPRVLSFVFNPVSFWYLRNSSNQLVVVVAEVNNTFDDTHCYVLHQQGQPITNADWLLASKQLYVSPFFQVQGYYRFCFRNENGRTQVRLNHHNPDNSLLLATRVGGKRLAMSKVRIARHGLAALVRVWMTLLRIHHQAFLLWIKGVGLVPRNHSKARTAKGKKQIRG